MNLTEALAHENILPHAHPHPETLLSPDVFVNLFLFLGFVLLTFALVRIAIRMMRGG